MIAISGVPLKKKTEDFPFYFIPILIIKIKKNMICNGKKQ